MVEKPHFVIIARGGNFWLGGRQYTMSLLQALVANRDDSDDYDVSLLVNGQNELVNYEPLRSGLKICSDTEDVFENWTVRNRIRWKVKRTFRGWKYPRLEEALQRLGATFAYPVSASKLPSADWISDFQYHHFPDGASPAEIAMRKLEFSNIVDHAQRIVLSSSFVEADCHSLFPQSIGRTSVLPFRSVIYPHWMAANPLQTVQKYHLPEKFVLVSNWLLPTKNHALVLDALAEVSPSERQTMHVVFTGDIYDYRNPGFYNSFLAKIHKLDLRCQVSILGVIPKTEQVQLLRSAVAYLQPSLSEGWNTGVEEAHLFGKRILLSDIAVHREQAPPRATYFNPRDPADLSHRLSELFGSPQGPSANPDAERAAIAAYEAFRRGFARDFISIAGTVGDRSRE